MRQLFFLMHPVALIAWVQLQLRLTLVWEKPFLNNGLLFLASYGLLIGPAILWLVVFSCLMPM